MMSDDHSHIPLLIDFSDKNILILGSGTVAERKVHSFLSSNNIFVIADNFSASLRLSAEEHSNITLKNVNLTTLSEVEIITLLEGVFLVIPATSNVEFNQKVASIAKLNSVLINRVDTIGEVILPAVVNQGNITLSIATGGQSPALSKFIKKQLTETITIKYHRMSELQGILRDQLKVNIPQQNKRKQLLSKILESEKVWQALETSVEKGLLESQQIISSLH